MSQECLDASSASSSSPPTFISSGQHLLLTSSVSPPLSPNIYQDLLMSSFLILHNMRVLYFISDKEVSFLTPLLNSRCSRPQDLLLVPPGPCCLLDNKIRVMMMLPHSSPTASAPASPAPASENGPPQSRLCRCCRPETAAPGCWPGSGD